MKSANGRRCLWASRAWLPRCRYSSRTGRRHRRPPSAEPGCSPWRCCGKTRQSSFCWHAWIKIRKRPRRMRSWRWLSTRAMTRFASESKRFWTNARMRVCEGLLRRSSTDYNDSIPMLRFIGSLSLVLICAAAPPANAPIDGKALLEKNSTICNKPGADNRAPLREALQRLPTRAMGVALESGSMKAQGAALTTAERQAIADFLVPKTAASIEPARTNTCPAGAKPLANLNGWNGWGADLVNTRMQSEKEGGIRAADVPKLKVKWAFGFPDAASVFGQPTVAGGRLFFGSGNGTIYSLDANTGCVYWTYKAPFHVRSAITIVESGKGQFAAYFGDGQANVYALNAQTGELLWKVKIDDHKMAGITGSPKVYGGRVYVGVRSGGEEVVAANVKYPCCTFPGSLVAIHAATGKQVGKTYTIPDTPAATRKNSAGTDLYGPSGAAVWSSPTIDVKRKAVSLRTGNNYSDPPTRYSDAVLAFDLETGSMRWSKQMNPDLWNFSCSQPVN